MKKTWMVVVAMLAVLLAPLTAYAHQGHTHKAMGVVFRVVANQVELTTRDGKTLKVLLDVKTQVLRGKTRVDPGLL
jgi:hypothetical protein